MPFLEKFAVKLWEASKSMFDKLPGIHFIILFLLGNETESSHLNYIGGGIIVFE